LRASIWLMRDFLYRLVERLHDQQRPLSRNRHFHSFTGSEARRALRIDKHLRDLENHLTELHQAGKRPRVRPLPGGGAQLVLQHLRLAVVRTATLSAEEVLLLREHPAGAWALAEISPDRESGQDPSDAPAPARSEGR